jgi:hypothetical protein
MDTEQKFNFTKRRAQRGEEKQQKDRRDEEREANLVRESSQIAAALRRDFPQGEFSVRQEGSDIMFTRLGTGRSLTIKVMGQATYNVTEGPGAVSYGGGINMTGVDEVQMMDAVEDWSKA